MINSIPRRSILCACIVVLSISTVAYAANDDAGASYYNADDTYSIGDGDDINDDATDPPAAATYYYDSATSQPTPEISVTATDSSTDYAVTATDPPTVSTTNKSTLRPTAAATVKVTAAATVKTNDGTETVKTAVVTNNEEAVETQIEAEATNDEEAVDTQIVSEATNDEEAADTQIESAQNVLSQSNLESSASSRELKIFPVLLVVVGLGIF